jgi:hypothetical protein
VAVVAKRMKPAMMRKEWVGWSWMRNVMAAPQMHMMTTL